MKNPLDKLVKALRKLPGVGEKTAVRFAFYFLNAQPSDVDALIAAIKAVKENLRLCSVCFQITEHDPCSICGDVRRDASRLCVVENPIDVFSIEKAGVFRGVYHVLHGALSPLEGIGPRDIKLTELFNRIRSAEVTEVIFALNPTVEAESTLSFIQDNIGDSGVKLTRIAYGLPMGGSLEYADSLTITRALENRNELG